MTAGAADTAALNRSLAYVDGYYDGYALALAHARLKPCGKSATDGSCYLAPGHPGNCYPSLRDVVDGAR